MGEENRFRKRVIECIENGIELDKEGHALLRMEQRKIDFEITKATLKSYDKVADIEEYNRKAQ